VVPPWNQTGGVIGFVLAQLVNIAKVTRQWWVKPRLAITLGSDGTVLLSHDPESEIEHRPLREVWHGFQVRNTGRRVATGVRFQIFKIEIRDRGQPRGDFYLISDSAINLSMYTGARGGRGAKEATLIPSAAVSVALAYWREDHGMVRPAGEFASDYYDENCSQAGEYRFSVCAFDDGKEYTTATFVVEPG
jgi:hypothetical protein